MLKLITAAALAVTCAAPALAVNLVANGDFEGGFTANVPNGWTLSNNFGYTGAGAGDNSPTSYRNGAVGSDGLLSQTVATVAGKTYAYSFDLKNEGGPTNDFSASLGGTSFGPTLSNATSFDYTVYSGTVVAPTANATLTFAFRQDPSYWDIDNVSLVASGTPEPATWALMIGGFGLVGGALRRRTAAFAG